MKVLDLGNNEQISRGLFLENDGTYLAMTFTKSKIFKTQKAGIKWLSSMGIDSKGNKLA